SDQAAMALGVSHSRAEDDALELWKRRGTVLQGIHARTKSLECGNLRCHCLKRRKDLVEGYRQISCGRLRLLGELRFDIHDELDNFSDMLGCLQHRHYFDRHRLPFMV